MNTGLVIFVFIIGGLIIFFARNDILRLTKERNEALEELYKARKYITTLKKSRSK